MFIKRCNASNHVYIEKVVRYNKLVTKMSRINKRKMHSERYWGTINALDFLPCYLIPHCFDDSALQISDGGNTTFVYVIIDKQT